MLNKHFRIKLFLLVIFCFLLTGSSVAQKKLTDTISAIKALQENASKNLQKQNYMDAVQDLNQANKLVLASNYRTYKPELLISVAELYYNLQYFDKAKFEIEDAIELLEQLPNDQTLAKAYYLAGLINSEKGDAIEASKNISKSENLYNKINNFKFEGKILFARGLLELNSKNFDTAISNFNKAIPFLKDENSLFLEAYSYTNLSDAYSQLKSNEGFNSSDLSKQALNNSNEIAKKNGFSKLITENHRIQSQIFLNEKNGLNAETELQTYLHQIDSVKQIRFRAIEEGVEAESALLDFKKIIESQKDSLNKQSQTLFFGKLTGWLSIALILILSLLTLSLYKNNNLRAKANELLKDKNTELILAKENAEKAIQVKAQFLSTITHELRTPMYTVTGLTHLLLEEDPMPAQKEHLNSLKISGEYLLSLINNILDLNKLEANKVELENNTFNLKKRVDGVVTALKKSAEAKNNVIHFDFDKNLPLEIKGDSLKLSQILINLVSNSIKFTENGDIWLRVNKTGEKGNKIFINFEIQDNGDGISKKKQKTIFESFSQGSLQINRKYGGTGLGLSIVKNLLELMGSNVYLDSQLGKGSKFWFTIQYELSEMKTIASEENILEREQQNDVLENKSVLIVEDNKINQMITKKILEKKNMVCKVVDNGLDAIEIVKANDFDVILMDIHMPGISGIETTTQLRNLDVKTPIIALTALTIEQNIEEFHKAGFTDFIPKPFKADDFFSTISKALKKV